MPTITNFGDVVTTGNTVLQGNLSVLNQSTFLTGNLLPNVAGSSNLGQAGTPFGSSWITSMNATSLNVTSANISSLNVSSTINIAGANVATLNVSSLNVSSENVSSLNVSSTAFISGANITTANVSSLNVTTGANVSTLTVSSFANILSANIVTANHATLNVTTANVASLNVSTGANVSWLTVTTGSNLIQSNIVTANVGTGNISTANVSSLNVSGTAFLTSANLTTANVSSLNVTSGANVTVLTVSTLANIVSANVVTANIGTANVSVSNTSSLNVSGTAFLSNANVLTGNITTANVLSLNVTGDANIAQNLTIKSNLYTSNIIMSSNLSTNTGQGNVYVSANLVVNGNIYSIGGSVGSGSGTSQGVIYALGANYTLGAAFVTGSAGPSIAGYHIDLSAFSPQAVQAVSSFSATSGMLKFTSAGLYQVQLVLVGDQAVSKVGIGSTSSGSFAALPTGSTGATSGYVYVYNYVAGSSPSTLVTIPLNITDVSKWYYLDTYFSTAAGYPTIMYPTAPTGGSSAGSNYGTFVQVSPFGNYLTSATGVAAGLLANCSSSSNLSGSYSSNAYRVTLTTANGWTVNGTSTAITAPTANGYFTVNQAGIYEVSMCLNTVGATPVQFQLGSLSSDTLSPAGTTASYLYTYAPMYTQDPTTTISMPVNITNISNVYFVECSFQGSSTANIALSSTSTFLSIKPVGSYVTPATNPWSASGSLVYYSNGAVGIGTSGSPTETLTVYGNTSFVSNVTVTSDASSNNYVVAKRVPAGSLSVANYVTGSVPLTTTTNLIQNYLSNAATITANTSTGTITQALYVPGTVGSCVNFQNAGSSVALIPTNTTNVFVEAWINPAVTSAGMIAAVGTSTQLWNFFLSSNYLVFNCSGGGTQTASSLPLSAGTWYHVAISLTPGLATKANIWVNGTQTTYSTTASSLPAALASANVYIGQNYAGSNFTGNVADVRIWSGGTIPTTATRPSGFTAAAAPFGISQPAYITGTPTLLMSLNSQYFPGASTSPYGPCLTLPGTVGSYYSAVNTAYDTNWKTNGFCLEAWVNYASFANSNLYYSTSSGPFMLGHFNQTNSYDWGFGALTTGQVGMYWDIGPSSPGTVYSLNTASTSTITTGSWNHLMIQSNGSNIYCAINGVFQTLGGYGYTPAGNGTIAPAASATALVRSGIPLTVGQFGAASPNFAIAKARLTFGTSGNPALGNVYSSGNFTPSPNLGPVPAGATIAWSLDSQFPLPTYPSIQDVTELPQQASSYGSLPTPVGGVTSNVLGPYTGTQLNSIRFDGTGYIDYGNAATSVMTSNIWASPWTIEGWVYPTTSFANYPGIFARSNASTSELFFYILPTGNITLAYGPTPVYNYGSLTAPLNTWTHVAATYDGTRSNVYVGGALSNSMVATTTAMTFTPTFGTQVGTWSQGSFNMIGNLADLRVSNVARYTGSSYTVPNVADGSGPFKTDANTLLLLKSLSGQQGTTLEVQGRGLNAVSLGATRSVQAYPPAPMSSYLLDTTSNASVTYGQGKYVASASSEYNIPGAGGYSAWYAFDKVTSAATPNGDWASTALYSAGAYTGTVVTIDTLGNSYPGEWIQLQMPVSILLSSFVSYNVNPYGPTLFWLLGSRDGINWTLVYKYSGSAFATQTFTVNATQSYNYYRFVVGTLLTGYGTTNMYELIFNGTEESLCITSDAKVGVGIANPQRSLEVAGDLVVSGTISGGAGMGSFRNRIINGDMRIAQRGTSSVVPSSGTNYLVDRFNIQTSISAGSITQYQNTLSVSDTPYQLGLKYASNIVVNSAVTASYVVPGHFIESNMVQDFNWGTSFGTPVTFSMWFKTNAPSGSQFNINISNYGFGAVSYNIPVIANSGVWQYIVATVPPPPNGGTWSYNGGSIQIYIAPYNPAQLVASSSAWTSTYGLYGNYPWVSYAGTSISFTGVQLEKGTVATPFEFRPYATELQLCQRYFIRLVGLTDVYHVFGMGMATTATTAWIFVRLPVNMRTSPTFASNTSSSYILTIGGPSFPVVTALSVIANDSSGVEAVRLDATVASGMTSGGAVLLRANNTLYGYLDFIAEL